MFDLNKCSIIIINNKALYDTVLLIWLVSLLYAIKNMTPILRNILEINHQNSKTLSMEFWLAPLSEYD